ncbi:SDR family oxidoreductase [Dactylosporangium sp. NPDC000244]|uniref:SDR family oxidoreductase n=1 Tax=Dactylosporangium sp. NPDC000244 TaxID=3154365 RepID=UPI00331EB07B
MPRDHDGRTAIVTGGSRGIGRAIAGELVRCGARIPTPRMGFYNATKAALDHLTRQLAAELAPAVRVNAVAPGLIDTDMAAGIPEPERAQLLSGIPMGRFGAPEDIATITSFLLSDRAGWMTGQVVAVDGGALVAHGRVVR